jgi:hypothetical protein
VQVKRQNRILSRTLDISMYIVQYDLGNKSSVQVTHLT